MLPRLSQATTQSDLTAQAPIGEGGLLTLVKEGIVFQRAAEDYSPPLERLTIQIQWLNIGVGTEKRFEAHYRCLGWLIFS